MSRDSRFTFLCNSNERQMIANLAASLQRSQSDAVRFLVVEAAKQLPQTETVNALETSPANTKHKGGKYATA